MNISGINYESISDGEGVRCVIFVSGCSHSCSQCHNPETHNPNYGVKFTEELINECIEEIKKRPFVSGITLSGGDPLYDGSLKEVLDLIYRFKREIPSKTIWLYTGYTWEEVFNSQILKNLEQNNTLKGEIISGCDVVIDGKFEICKRDTTLRFRGSSNQRIIDIQKSLKENKIVLYTE